MHCLRAGTLGFCLIAGAGQSQTAGVGADVPAADTSAQPATPALEPADESSPPAGETVVSRIEANLDFDRLMAAQRFADALPIGEQVVTLTEQEFGKNSAELGKAVLALAQAQRQAGQHPTAETNFLRSIDIYRSVDGAFSALVIEPLTGLGDNYHDNGQYLNAVSAYGEARTVNRRAFGLLNEQQIVLLDRLTESLIGLNQPLEADQRQIEALQLVERNHEPHSDEALSAIYKYAGWLRESGRFQEERDQYARALRTIREHYGKEDVHQVQPLIAIGNSYRSQRIPEGQGASALRDALTLLLARPERDPLAIAEVLRDLGDWEVAFSKVMYSGAEYRRAWQLLGEVKDGERLRAAWFTGPTYVLREPISQRGLSQEPDAPTGHVLVRFDLDAGGHSTAVTVVESSPPGLKDEAVTRHIRRSRFRPQMVNGEIVPAQGLALQFNFRYSPDALAEQEKEARRDD